MNPIKKELLKIESLKTHFYMDEGVAKAVDGVSLALFPGQTLGIVGESGSGKSVMALSAMRLIPEPPGKIVSGNIWFQCQDLVTLDEKQMLNIRGNRISMIFQEPMTSLNPLLTVGDQLAEMFIRHRGMSQKDSFDRAIEMLEKVQMPAPKKRAKEYPHQISGGMCQRVMIAMALSCDPEILIADEPTTALDVTIQAQVLDLMLDLKEKYGTAIMMITHDLSVIAEVAHQVVVMYAGQVVETGDVFSIFDAPKHPYTQALLGAIPKIGNRSRHGRQRLEDLPGIVPSLYHLPKECSFYPRCKQAVAQCRETKVDLISLGQGINVRCRRYASNL